MRRFIILGKSDSMKREGVFEQVKRGDEQTAVTQRHELLALYGRRYEFRICWFKE